MCNTSNLVPLLYLVLCCVEEVRSEVLCIDGASLSISGCPGCVTVVGNVGFEILAGLCACVCMCVFVSVRECMCVCACVCERVRVCD